ncbi:MAG TPA: MFS transporter [Actinophytocola sp.]|jgi:DHA2 family methylenomycin A resistance protein-like MFS transporter|nr:MFS transporter [Actinophytocola sp.]
MAESARETRILLVTMCAGYFLVLLDVTAMNVAVPRIGAEFAVGGGPLAWVVTGYSVPFAALLLVAGATGDRIGHRPMVRAGLAVFGVASLACALAPGLGWLIAARAMQGAGAALLLPGTLAVIAAAYPDPGARAKAIGLWAAIGGLALPAGPVLCGFLVTATGWRSVFWLNLPIVAAASAVAAAVLPHARGDRTRRPDWVGAVLGTACLGLLVTGVAQSAWPLLAAAVVVAVVFVAAERRVREPMLPLSLFGDRHFVLPNLGGLVMNGATLGMMFLLTLYLQEIRGLDPLHSGLAILPECLPLVLIPPFAGTLITRFGAASVAAAGLAATAAGIALLTTAGATTPYLALLPALAIWGIGLGTLTPALVSGAVSAVPPARSGLASAVNNTARQSGGALGTAAAAALAGPVAGTGFLPGFRLTAIAAATICTATAVATGVSAFATRRSAVPTS